METGLYSIVFNYLPNDDKCNFIEHAPRYLRLYSIDLDFIKYIIDKNQSTWRIIKRLLFRGKLNDFLNKIIWIALNKHDLNCIKMIIKLGLILGARDPIYTFIRDSSEEIINYFTTPREIRIMRDTKLVTANIQITDFDKDVMIIKCRDGDLKYIKKVSQLYDISLMEIACANNHLAIAQHIGNIIHCASDTCLCYACEHNNYELVKYLLKYCKDGCKGVMIACAHGNLPILKLLIKLKRKI